MVILVAGDAGLHRRLGLEAHLRRVAFDARELRVLRVLEDHSREPRRLLGAPLTDTVTGFGPRKAPRRL